MRISQVSSAKGLGAANQNVQPQPLAARQKKSLFRCATGRFSWVRKFIGILAPGLVTGAADDDPSGIATYSSVGAEFGAMGAAANLSVSAPSLLYCIVSKSRP